MKSLRRLLTGAATALLATSIVVVGPTESAEAATCNVQGSRTATTAEYRRTGGTCSEVRAFIDRLNPSNGQVERYVGAWRSSGYSRVTASNGYPYGGGYQVQW